MKAPTLPVLALGAATCALFASSASAQTTLSVFPTADSWVRSGMPTTNYGTSTEMLVGTINATSGGNPGADISGADVGRALLSFDLSSPALTSALAGLTITSVTLTFTVNSTDGSSASNVVGYSLFRSGTFNAGTATWDSGRPVTVGSAVASLSVNPALLTVGNTVVFGESASLTGLVSGSLGGTLNLLLKQSTEGAPTARELLRLRTVDFAGTTSDPVLTITAIPEPSSFAALAGLGALGLVSACRRRAFVGRG